MPHVDELTGRPVPGAAGRLAARLLVRTGRGPLGRVWALAYATVARVVAALLVGGRRRGAGYVARSVGSHDAVYGLSDIDLVVVVPGDQGRPGAAHERSKRRWERLRSVVPALGWLLPDLAIYEDAELEAAVAGSIFAPSPGGEPTAVLFGRAPAFDDLGLRWRPGLLGPTRDWRLVHGRDRRPPLPSRGRPELLAGAWLELQYWWSYAFVACLKPGAPASAYLCAKLVTEPARIWLTLVDGRAPVSREGVLREALERLPEEETALRAALEVQRRPDRFPEGPLPEALACMVRLSERIAASMAAGADGPGQEVRLLGVGQPGDWLPLVDWRAVAVPSLPDEALRIVPGEPGAPRAVAAAARATERGRYAALRNANLLVLPALGVWSLAVMRAVQCPTTDPVSFALADGRTVARFPGLRGWAAGDWAARGVAEHAAWLRDRSERSHATAREWLDGWGETVSGAVRELAKLLTAARAGLFQDSIAADRPELAVTLEGVAAALARAVPRAGDVADEAVTAYRVARDGGADPPGPLLRALRRAVTDLDAYEGTGARA